MSQRVGIVQRFEAAGIRIIELNIGTPYGDEASAVRTERSSERVTALVSTIRAAISRAALWVKLTGQSEQLPEMVRAANAAGADAVVLPGRYMGLLPDLDSMEPTLGTNVGYGGARDGLDVARMMLCGARAVEMCSAVMTGGFSVLQTSLSQLSSYLEQKTLSASELVGRTADSVKSFSQLPEVGAWRRHVPPESRG